MSDYQALMDRLDPPQIAPTTIRRAPKELDERERYFERMLNSDQTPAQDVFNYLNAVGSSVGVAQGKRSEVSYGPYPISNGCDYDCGFMEYSWSWNPDYNSWFNFDNWFNFFAAMTGRFNTVFDPARSYLAQLGADLTQKFDEAVDQIKTIDADVRTAGGKITPEQEEALKTAYANAYAALSDANAQTNNLIQTFAQFIDQEDPYKAALQSNLYQITANARENVDVNRNDLLSGNPCGDGDINSAFDGINNSIQASTDTIMPSFEQVGANANATLGAIRLVTGAMLATQADHDGAKSDVTVAEGLEPSSYVRLIKLMAAKSSWSLMVQDAQGTLNT